MCRSIVVEQNQSKLPFMLWPFLEQWTIKINELLSVAICINRFTRFEELITDYTLLIPPNIEQSFFSEAIRSCSRCWWLAWIDPWFVACRILDEFPLFILNHNSIQKRLPFVPCMQHFTDVFSIFLLSLIQFLWNTFTFFLDLSHFFQAIKNGWPSNS